MPEERDRSPETSDGEPTDELACWRRFLAAETEEEQEALAMANPDILEAKTRLDELSADPKARKLAEDRVLWEWAYHQDIDGAERRGREQGLREGREQGLRDAVRTACELLGLELTDDRNAKLQGSSLEELKSLLAALKRDREWPG